MDYPIIIHGSENSLDVDAYVILPEPIEFKEAKKLCDSFKEINANLLVIKNGQVHWNYKGTKDECNNSILSTYSLHQQKHPNPIEQPMQRSYGLKMMRTIRGLLSYCSRTQYREEVKKALISDDLTFKIEVLKNINLQEIKDFEKSSLVETYKFFAFQMGQTRALLEDNVELFTKNSVSDYYPSLREYLERKETSVDNLYVFYQDFVGFLEKSYTQVEEHNLYYTTFHGLKEVLNVKQEKVLPPVVIFDIDGTLMDESHRAYLRENKEWEKYFSLCLHDEPINHIIELTHQYKEKGYEVWVMSGRSISTEKDTIESFKKHNVYYDNLKLRGHNNFIPDYVIKPSWAKKLIGIERIEAIYDDSPRVIEAFRDKGLNVIDVTQMPTPTGKPHYKKI